MNTNNTRDTKETLLAEIAVSVNEFNQSGIDRQVENIIANARIGAKRYGEHYSRAVGVLQDRSGVDGFYLSDLAIDEIAHVIAKSKTRNEPRAS